MNSKTNTINEKEIERLEVLSFYENECYLQGFTAIAGVDEAGRGPLAGPVVAGAVILPRGCLLAGINDSKKISEKKRERLFLEIKNVALAVGLGIVDVATIDEINILQATYEAMRLAVQNLSVPPDCLLVDGNPVPGLPVFHKSIVQGDSKSISIGAASIIAKVTRDAMMRDYAELYPQYGFQQHKGYGTKAHVEALRQYGPCPIHRRLFVKNFVEAE